jgi:HTH-type transcriptional regulator/antitoxin HipB
MQTVMQLRTPRDIGGLIRARRRSLCLDQRTLAARVGVSRLWIGEIERGKPGASLGLVLRTLAELGMTLSVPDEVDHAGAPTAETIPPMEGPDINAILEAARRR